MAGTCEGAAPKDHLVCEACGNWTSEPATLENAIDFGMEVVEVDGEDTLLCEWCL